MRHSLAPTLLLAVLAGCASLQQGASGSPPAGTAPDVIQAAQLSQLNSLLTAMVTVVSGTPSEQAEVMAGARAGYENARGAPAAALRYGLLLAAPLHPARDPVQAQLLLREALARPELLGPLEEALATVELERVNFELLAGAENQRLAEELRQERERQRGSASSAALTRQLQAANELNTSLRRQLDEARAKLDAIAELERRQAPPASQ
jgi:hypothetical protein